MVGELASVFIDPAKELALERSSLREGGLIRFFSIMDSWLACLGGMLGLIFKLFVSEEKNI